MASLASLAPLLFLVAASAAGAGPWSQVVRAAESARSAGDLVGARRSLERARALASGSWLGTAPSTGEAPDSRLPATLAALADLERQAGRAREARGLEQELLRYLRAHPHPGGHVLQAQLRKVARMELSEGDAPLGTRLAQEALAWARAHPYGLDDLEQAEVWSLRVELATTPAAPLSGPQRRELLLAADHDPAWAAFSGEREQRVRLHRALAEVEDTPEDRAFHAVRATALASDDDPRPGLAWDHLHATGRAAARAHDLARAASWLRRAAEAPDATRRQRADSLVELAHLSEVCEGCALPDPLGLLRQAHEIFRDELGPTAPEALDAWAARARHLARGRGELEPLRVALGQLAEVRSRAGDPAGASETHLELADLARQAGDVPAALEHLEAAVTFAQRATPAPATPEAAAGLEEAVFRQAATLRALGRHAQEADAWRGLLPALSQAYGRGHRRHAWRQLSVAEALERAGESLAALEVASPALAALREVGPALALEYALQLVGRLEGAVGAPGAAGHLAEARAWARAQDPFATSS